MKLQCMFPQKRVARFGFLFLVFLSSCDANEVVENANQSNERHEFDLFTDCDIILNDTIITNEYFQIGYPEKWRSTNELPQGIDIEYSDQDSIKHGFMLSCVPYSEIYFKPNKFVKYVKFQRILYDGYEGVFFMRNDLFPEDETVYWRGELRLYTKDKSQAYFLVFGSRASRNAEPDWCRFSSIFRGFSIRTPME